MGFYYGSSEPPADDKPPGCLDALLIARAVFAVILPIALAMIVLLVDISVTLWAFTVHPALALVPIVLSAVAIWLLARWDQRRHRPAGL